MPLALFASVVWRYQKGERLCLSSERRWVAKGTSSDAFLKKGKEKGRDCRRLKYKLGLEFVDPAPQQRSKQDFLFLLQVSSIRTSGMLLFSSFFFSFLFLLQVSTFIHFLSFFFFFLSFFFLLSSFFFLSSCSPIFFRWVVFERAVESFLEHSFFLPSFLFLLLLYFFFFALFFSIPSPFFRAEADWQRAYFKPEFFSFFQL